MFHFLFCFEMLYTWGSVTGYCSILSSLTKNVLRFYVHTLTPSNGLCSCWALVGFWLLYSYFPDLTDWVFLCMCMFVSMPHVRVEGNVILCMCKKVYIKYNTFLPLVRSMVSLVLFGFWKNRSQSDTSKMYIQFKLSFFLSFFFYYHMVCFCRLCIVRSVALFHFFHFLVYLRPNMLDIITPFLASSFFCSILISFLFFTSTFYSTLDC